MTQSTSEYRIGHGSYLLAMARHLGAVPLVAVGVLTLAALVVGVAVDVRWLIAGLMGVFILMPMVAALLYFNYGLRPEGFVNVLPHSVRFEERHIEVEVTFPARPEDEDEEGEGHELKRRTYRFEIEPPVRYSAGREGITVPLGRPRCGVLIIPYAAFAGEEHLRRVAGILTGQKTIDYETDQR